MPNHQVIISMSDINKMMIHLDQIAWLLILLPYAIFCTLINSSDLMRDGKNVAKWLTENTKIVYCHKYDLTQNSSTTISNSL